MPTYVYETIPQQKGERRRTYEIRQKMSDKALRAHPRTGEPIRRIPAGGAGVTGFAEPECGVDCGVPGSGGSCCPGWQG